MADAAREAELRDAGLVAQAIQRPFSVLQSQMHAVPSGLNLLARLCLISTAKDFSLDTTKTYDNLTHPGSFAACLDQVCHLAYKAFLEGDSAMKDIVAGTNVIQDEMRRILDLLLGSSSKKERFVKMSAESVEETAQECIAAAEKVAAMFQHVIDMLAELSSATLAAQKDYKDAKEEAEVDQANEDTRKARFEEEVSKIHELREKLEKDLNEEKKAYMLAARDAAAWEAANNGGPPPPRLDSVEDVISLPVNLVVGLVGGIVSLFKKSKPNPHMARMKQHQEQMLALRDKIDKTFDREMETDREITEAVVKLQRLNFEVISHQERLEVIHECLQVFARVRDRWTALIEFFRTLSGMLKMDLNKRLMAFLREAKELADESALGREEERLLRVGMAAASREATKIYHLASCYIDISGRHFMPMVRQMGTLLVLDGGSVRGADREEVVRRMGQLDESTEREQRELADIVARSRQRCEGQLLALETEWGQ